MSWTVEGLEAEYQEAHERTKEAWAAFCIARAELPIYHAFRVIRESYKIKVAADKLPLPTDELAKQYARIRRKLIDEAYLLPEFKEYERCREEEKESKLVWIDAKMRYGGGGNED